MKWKAWSTQAFDEARQAKKPLLISFSPISELAVLESLIGQKFVAMSVDRDERPDLELRYGASSDLAILALDGRVLARLDAAGPDLQKSLSACAQTYVPPAESEPKIRKGPVWTGAVGEGEGAALNPEWPLSVLSQLKGKKKAGQLSIEDLEFLLYAAREWSDAESKARFIADFSAIEASVKNEKRLKPLAQTARFLWDAYALTQIKDFGRVARELTERINSDFFDPEVGAFASTRGAGAASFHVDANALAVLMLLRASGFSGGVKHLEKAKQVLRFLEAQAYTPEQGMAHRTAPGSKEHSEGFLGDNVWTIMALTEAFQMTAEKSYREMADALLKYLFQEFWERERGGFLDRIARADDAAALRIPVISLKLNAVAFEAAWRMHQLKGNANYLKWIQWGLKSLVRESQTRQNQDEAPALARVQDILGRSRLDLEMVGNIKDEKTQAIVSALNRHYLPRRIISFVDPDDQDYIMAHKLENASYPCLFACGPDLRPVGRADSPEKIAAMLDLFLRRS